MTTAPADFHGIFPYLVSPIDESTGHVREAVLRDLIEHLIGQGVHGLSPLGSTGEIVYLTAEQRVALVRATVDAVGGRVPVALRQAEALVNLGVDGLIVMLQTQFPVSRAGIERYFRTIAEAVPVPVVLYTNPGLGGADVTPEIVEALSHVPNIRYVKDASGRTGRILAILNRVGDRVKVFSALAGWLDRPV
jgi:4-hydroxy-tetrahydrodipicolinate synthase